jgi:hypothetical protein
MCPPGAVPDLSLYHQDQCTLPSDALFYIFLEVFVLAGGLVCVLLHKMRSTKGDARSLLASTVLALSCACGVAIGEWLQGGFFEVAAVFTTSVIIVVSHLGKQLLALALKPASKIRSGGGDTLQVLRFWRYFNVAANSVLCICCVVQIVYCRQSSAFFNPAMVALLFIVSMYMLILPTGVFVYLKRLELAMGKVELSAPAVDSRREKLGAFAQRIFILRINLVVLISTCLPLVLVVNIVFLTVEFFPYAWIAYAVVVNSPSFIACAILLLLRTSKRAEVSSSTTTQNAGDVVVRGGAETGRDSVRTTQV